MTKVSHGSTANGRLWTVMVYMAGDYYLNNGGFTDLKEMKKVGSTKDINVIAQFSRCVKKRPTKRYYFSESDPDGPLSNDVVEDIGETNPIDPKVLEDFICWGFEKFPAKHYLVVVWGHGNGADDENIPNAETNLLLPDDSTPNLKVNSRFLSRSSVRGIGIRPSANIFEGLAVDFLDNRKFKKALESATEMLGRKIDILGMDSCLMSGAEVCYQMRNSTRFTVACEGIGPADGWPYDKILTELASKPTISPRELASRIVERYLAFYTDYEDVAVTQSACDLSKCPALAIIVDRLAEVLLNNLSDKEVRKAVMLSRWQAQSYEGTEYVDLYDFCSLLHYYCNRKRIKVACREVMKTIGPGGFVLKSGYRGHDAQYSYGLSIYFPQDEISRFYERLDFANDTRWVEFLKEYITETRRPDRSKKRGFAMVE
jgi:Clostripain family